MRERSTFVILLLSLCFFAANSQERKDRDETFALTNATLHTITNGTIENGILIIHNEKIQSVGRDTPIPSEATVVDCAGLHVYPGMIDGGTVLGMTEIAGDPRTRDFEEVGDINPQMKALTAINPNSVLIPVTRVSGVTTVLAAPRGGLFSGTAALISLHGYTPEQMYAGFEGVVMNFPSSVKRNIYDKRPEEEIKMTRDRHVKALNEVWEKALQYHKLDSASGGNTSYFPEVAALLPVIRGEMALLIDVNAAPDIRAALEWIEKQDIRKPILTGVSEGWRVADEIAASGVPVIAGPVLTLPPRAYDRYDRVYTNAGLMKKAGVKVAIRTVESENVRNLPFHAGFAAAYGLGKEEALKAVTIIPAEIFGVADKLGSLEPGKQATLFISDGDPFEPATQIKHLFINGWKIPLESRQTDLYQEFLQREPGYKK